jgi:hypothetical protein
MATLFVTQDKGGAGRPTNMTVVPPTQLVPPKTLKAISADGLDGLVLADMLSAIAMHDRAAARFARSAAKQTDTPELRKIHEKLAQLHTDRVDALESLLTKLKLPRLYASPASRVAGYLAESLTRAPLLAGSIEAEALELTLLDVAFTLAERSLADTRALAAVADKAKGSNTAAALAKTVKSMTSGVQLLEKVREARTKCLVNVVTLKGP